MIREPFLKTRGIHNFRDYGGWRTRDGGQVRTGLLFRSGHHVEATDDDENVFKGCARVDCNTFSGDSTHAVITWKKQNTIPHTGRLRLRFFMRNASLYSIQLTAPA